MSAARTFWTITSARVGPLLSLELVQMSYDHEPRRVVPVPAFDPRDKLAVAKAARFATRTTNGSVAFSSVLAEMRKHGAE